MKFVPNSDRVLVLIEDPMKKYAAVGLVAPATAQYDGEARIGRVVAVGTGRPVEGVFPERLGAFDEKNEVFHPNGKLQWDLWTPPFAEGDLVVLDPVGGLKIKLDGVEHVIVRNEEILGKLAG